VYEVRDMYKLEGWRGGARTNGALRSGGVRVERKTNEEMRKWREKGEG
jgi:hypothetical protein